MEERLIEMLVQELPDSALDEFNTLLDKENLNEDEIKNFLVAHNVNIEEVLERLRNENR